MTNMLNRKLAALHGGRWTVRNPIVNVKCIFLIKRRVPALVVVRAVNEPSRSFTVPEMDASVLIDS